jgi:nicotinamide-nucleotide adenylyltransferase
LTAEEGSSELPALFVGRFQPFHKGHLFMTKRILEDFDQILIGVGSAQYSHKIDNPFSYEERSRMIGLALDIEGLKGCRILPIDDVHNHATWVTFVESAVPTFGVVFSNDPLTIKLFQEKGYDVREQSLYNRDDLSGTEVRERMASGKDWEDLVPGGVAEYIREIEGAERVKELATSDRGEGQEGYQSDQ